MFPALFLFRIAFAIWDVLYSHTNFKIVFTSSVKNATVEVVWGFHFICRLLWVEDSLTILILQSMNTRYLSIYVCLQVSFINIS